METQHIENEAQGLVSVVTPSSGIKSGRQGRQRRAIRKSRGTGGRILSVLIHGRATAQEVAQRRAPQVIEAEVVEETEEPLVEKLPNPCDPQDVAAYNWLIDMGFRHRPIEGVTHRALGDSQIGVEGLEVAR